MKFSWKGQLIDIPSTSGGTSTASANNSWIRYLSDAVSPTFDTTIVVSKNSWSTLANAVEGDRIFVLYGYAAAEEEGGGEDAGTEETASYTSGEDVGEILPDETLPDEMLPDEEISDVYDYWTCTGIVKTVDTESVTITLDTVVAFSTSSSIDTPTKETKMFTISNHVDGALSTASDITTIDGGFSVSNIPWDIFGVDPDGSTTNIPKPDDRFVGYLWFVDRGDATTKHKHFVTGTIESASYETNEFGYHDTYDIFITSSVLIEYYAPDANASVNTFVVENDSEGCLELPYTNAVSLGNNTIGMVTIPNIPNAIFGLNRQNGVVGVIPKVGDNVTGVLWVMEEADLMMYRYKVVGKIQSVSSTVDANGYPSFVTIVVESGVLLETIDDSAPAPAEDYATVRVEEIVSNNWTIRKYEDGYVDMSRSAVIQINMNVKVGDKLFVSSTTFDEPYPMMLTKNFSCDISISAPNFTVFPICASSDNTLMRTNKWRSIGYTEGATTRSVIVQYHVTGRWK